MRGFTADDADAMREAVIDAGADSAFTDLEEDGSVTLGVEDDAGREVGRLRVAHGGRLAGRDVLLVSSAAWAADAIVEARGEVLLALVRGAR